MRRAWGILIASLSLTACINITTRLQPEDLTVKETLSGSDCVPMILGFAYGTADATAAMRDAERIGDTYSRSRIARVRHTDYWDFEVLGTGVRCVEVVGEAEQQPKLVITPE